MDSLMPVLLVCVPVLVLCGHLALVAPPSGEVAFAVLIRIPRRASHALVS